MPLLVTRLTLAPAFRPKAASYCPVWTLNSRIASGFGMGTPPLVVPCAKMSFTPRPFIWKLLSYERSPWALIAAGSAAASSQLAGVRDVGGDARREPDDLREVARDERQPLHDARVGDASERGRSRLNELGSARDLHGFGDALERRAEWEPWTFRSPSRGRPSGRSSRIYRRRSLQSCSHRAAAAGRGNCHPPVFLRSGLRRSRHSSPSPWPLRPATPDGSETTPWSAPVEPVCANAPAADANTIAPPSTTESIRGMAVIP